MLYTNNNFTCVAIILVSVSCVKSLKTGYSELNPIGTDFIEKVKLLKCSYLFNAIFTMKVYGIFLESPGTNMDLVIKEIHRYSTLLKKKISTLFFVEGIELGSLWLLNLHTSDFDLFVYGNVLLQRGDILFNNIMNTLSFVIEKLIEDVKDCPDGSQFFISDSIIMKFVNTDMTTLDLLQKQKYREINFVLKKNHENGQLRIFNERIKMFTKPVLFMKRFTDRVRNDIMLNTYNLQVTWGPSGNLLNEMYDSTRFFEWRSNNFLHQKRYLKSVFSFFKMIMFRLTWKHMLYIKYQNFDDVVYLVEKWIVFLNNFSTALRFENDVMINRVKEMLNEFIGEFNRKTLLLTDEPTKIQYHQERVDNFIENLKPLLNVLCADLGCNATLQLELNGKESNPVKTRKFISPPVHDVSSYDTINFYSITFTEHFINFVRCFFFKESLSVIHAFIDYIDELSKFKPFYDFDLGIRISLESPQNGSL